MRSAVVGFAIAGALAALLPVSTASAQCVGAGPDGSMAPTESCDDGNAAAGDGCSATCTIEASWSCARSFDFDLLQIHDYPGGGGTWTIGSVDTGVQTINTQTPSVALFGDDAMRGTYSADVRVETTNDDDIIGLALGFEPGDEASAAADWVLIDWKQALQQTVPAGLRFAHITGAPNGGLSIDHDLAQRRCPGGGPVGGCARQLALGRRFGTQGWADNTTYRLRVEYRPDHLQVWVDNQLELDLVPGDFPGEFAGNVFPGGQIGFYVLSQDGVRYTDLTPAGPSVCNTMDLADATVQRPLGSANATVAVSSLFTDVGGDALDPASITVLDLPAGATATVVNGNLVVTPANPNQPAIYQVHLLACDNDPVVPDCDDAVVTVVYSADTDGDGVLDGADLDDDNDGIPDRFETDLGVDPDGDHDGDGVPNYLDRSDRGDGQPQTCTDAGNDGRCDVPGPVFDRDGDGQPNHRDLDADGDGLLDVVEAGRGIVDGNRNGVIDCPGGSGTNGLCDAIETAADSGVLDYDHDGVGPDPVVDTDGDGVRDFLDLDSDGDGLTDLVEGESGCADTTPRNGRCDGNDSDRDGVVNSIDGATGWGTAPYPVAPDSDGDGLPDYRELDSDGDGLLDRSEGDAGCADSAPPPGRCDGPDADGDGLADDAAATVPDTDGDGQPDYQDLDADGDGLRDAVEGERDTDGDGHPDFRDLDSDDDGLADQTEGGSGCADTAPRNGRCDGPDANRDGLADDATNPTPPDTDGDGAPDFRDLDSDNDGGPDRVEGPSPCADSAPADAVCDGPDGNGDGRADDAGNPVPRDTDGDGVPDYRDLDSDQDGLLDVTELASGCLDGNANGVCDGPDTDHDGIADSIDDAPTFGDPMLTAPPNRDGDGLPDYRDPDADGDGTPDTTASGCADTSPADQRCDGVDTDRDGVVDPIDGFDGFGVAADTDGDGVADPADLDDDNDGIPDADEAGVDTDGDGLDDGVDLDSDNDGRPDVAEAGHGQADADGDGTLDCPGGFGANGLCDAVETAPDGGTRGYTILDTDGDGVPDFRDLDSDDDGLSDLTENGTTCTDGEPDGVCDGGDADGDGVVDSGDHTAGFGAGGYPPAPDTDGDGTPDYRDLDSDGDGIFDLDEAGHGATDADDDGRVDGGDTDGDGLADAVDDLPTFGGAPPALDTDGDGTPDFRDLDSDGDTVSDADEAGPDPANPVDTDGDGAPDFQDADADDDAVGDATDDCRLVVNPDQADLDGDGLGDACDADANGDGFDDDLGLQGGGCAAGAPGGGSGALALVLLAGAALVATRRRRAGALALVIAGGGLVLAAPAARAQALETDYPVERFRLTGERDGLLDVEWADVSGHRTLDLGLWLGYADDPLNIYMRDAAGERERVASFVDHRLGGDLVGAIDLWRRVQLGIAVPLILDQGSDVGAIMGGDADLQRFGLGDLRLAPKLALVKQGRAPLSVAVVLGVGLPTSSVDDYGGDRGVVLAPELALSRSFGSGLRLAANAGYTRRATARALDLVVDDELAVRAGAGYRTGARNAEVDVTFALATAADDVLGAFNRNYAEAKLGAGLDATDRVRLFAAGGAGVAEGFGTPDWRVLAGVRVDPSPREAPARAKPEPVPPPPPADRDGDGLDDAHDNCPLGAEDADGFEDGDGCPDPDDDQDGVLDVDDACREVAGVPEHQGCPPPDRDRDTVIDELDSCPDVAGLVDLLGCPDRDGDGLADAFDNCPDEPGPIDNQGCAAKQLVKLTGGKLEILDVVYFKLNKAIIQKRSYPLLDNVASVLAAHPELVRVRVEGHTDSQGKDAYNKQLSQRRAEAVMAYLVAHGIDAGRLEAAGFGEERPIDDNRTKAGRAANRRVEFVIVGGADGIEQQRTGPGADTQEP